MRFVATGCVACPGFDSLDSTSREKLAWHVLGGLDVGSKGQNKNMTEGALSTSRRPGA